MSTGKHEDVTKIHEEKETLAVDVFLPGHEARVSTPLFLHSKKALMERDGPHCFICGATAEQSGHPLESHHHPIERSLANMIDWQRFAIDAKAGRWGAHAQAFDWDGFFAGAAWETIEVPQNPNVPGLERRTVQVLRPVDPYKFVDDQTVNGLILCKAHHTGVNEGFHYMPFPMVIAQKYAYEGYEFSKAEVIHHFEA